MVYGKAYRYINMYTYTIYDCIITGPRSIPGYFFLAGVAGQCHHQRCSKREKFGKLQGTWGFLEHQTWWIYGDLIGFHGDIRGIYELG